MDDKVAFTTIRQHFREAARLGGEGQFDEAVVELERAAEFARGAGKLGAGILPDILSNLAAFKAKAADKNVRFTVMNNRAAALLQAGKDAEARQAFIDLVEAYRRETEIDPADLARALTNLSVACTELRLDDEAQEHSRDACDTLKAAERQNDPAMAAVMHNWGYSHKTAGRWSAALHCFTAARRSLESDPDAAPLDVATMTYEMADLLRRMLQPEDGFRLAYNCMEARSKVLGTNDPQVAQAAQLAGRLLNDSGNYTKAVTYLRPAYQIYAASVGAYAPQTMEAVHDLFTASWKTGQEIEKVEADLRNMIPVAQSMGPNPLICRELTDLAGLLAARGAEEESRRLALEAAEAFKVLGDDFDAGRLAPYCEDLAALLTRQGQGPTALPLLERAFHARDVLIDQAVMTRDSVYRSRYQSRLQADTGAFVRHVMDHCSGDPRAATMAFEFVINRKGIRAESEMAHFDPRLAALQPGLAPILERIRVLETKIQEVHASGMVDGARKMFSQLDDLREELRDLNGEIETRTLGVNRPVRRIAHLVQAAEISMALPKESALVEYYALLVPPSAEDTRERSVLEESGDGDWLLPERTAERYVAFVLRSGQADVRMFDIGTAPEVERLIYSYLAAMSGGRRDLVPREWQDRVLDSSEEELSRGLREQLFDPLAGALDGCKTIFIAPDGAICRAPFGSFLDAAPSSGRLLDRLAIGYLVGGRDILEFGGSVPAAGEPPLVVGDPDYDFDKPGGTHAAPEPVEGFTDFYFERLPGTADEAWRVSQMIGGRRLTGQRANETAVRECRSPAILHIAAHGYYVRRLSQGLMIIGNWREGGGFGTMFRGEVLGRTGDPFLRSGIVLAGVNAYSENRPLPPEVGDGLLTSAEVAHIDLNGTELVVLSACSGALGDVRPADGVAGLLHGFRVAGARATVASLWQIPDEATEKLMEVFYKGLLAGRSRLEALCEAQRALEPTAQPWEWGSFVCYGDPGPVRYRPTK